MIRKKKAWSWPPSSLLVVVALFMAAVVVDVSSSELVVNVKNKGGDVQVESIEADTTADTVDMHFVKIDGTHVSQFIDFRSEVQIFRTIILPEEEQGQSQHQVQCFVMRYIKNEFISSDAMSKLRQKNPTAIRTPEDDKGRETHEQDHVVHLEKSQIISPYIYNICREAHDKIYARDADLRILARSLGKDYNTLRSSTTQYIPSKYPHCRDVTDLSKPCCCQYEICVGWYPCGLKYCRGRDSLGHIVSYRCGIKTCRKCRIFEYYSFQKANCMWDY